jgi:soluble lytic murein transglycosylase
MGWGVMVLLLSLPRHTAMCWLLLGILVLGAAPALAQPPPRQPAPRALPPVLHQAEAARLRHIFQLQARGEHEHAAQETARLAERRLHGHLMADAWSRPGGPEPSAEVLRSWLAVFADHPDAPRIAARLPPDQRPPPAMAAPVPPAPSGLPPPGSAIPRNGPLERALRERGRQGDLDGAMAQIARARAPSPEAEARLKAALANGLFQAGRDAEAWRLASEGAAAAPGDPDIAFTAGLAAWALGRWDSALTHFERAAGMAGDTHRAAAAFWAARAAGRARRPEIALPWLLAAAQDPRSFHGMIARRALGLGPGLAWAQETRGQAEALVLAETPGGWRALALLQVGQAERAEAELRLLWSQVQGQAVLARAVAVLAEMANLRGLVAITAQAEPDQQTRDFDRYPLPALRPAGGFSVDPALLYAIALQESRFDPAAISRAGARGLLQVMPATASFIASDPELRGEAASRLHDPMLSMELGQRYLQFLARSEITGGDLIRILAAYNAGPGNLQRWLPAQRHRADPFLFIESIPYDETRDYVQKVLSYSWIYASRLGLPAPSLDRMAQGKFPEFLNVAALTAMLAPSRPARAAPPAREAPQRLTHR